jgi:hypothetical protein
MVYRHSEGPAQDRLPHVVVIVDGNYCVSMADKADHCMRRAWFKCCQALV